MWREKAAEMLEGQRKLHRAIHHWLTKIALFFDHWRTYADARTQKAREGFINAGIEMAVSEVKEERVRERGAPADNSWLPMYVLALLGTIDMPGVKPLEETTVLNRMADSLRHMGCVVGAQLLEPLFALAAPQAVTALREGHATDFFPATGAVVKANSCISCSIVIHPF